jgi:hypothetical protein
LFEHCGTIVGFCELAWCIVLELVSEGESEAYMGLFGLWAFVTLFYLPLILLYYRWSLIGLLGGV